MATITGTKSDFFRASRNYFDLAKSCKEAGNYEEAVVHYTNAISLSVAANDTDVAGVYAMRGDAYFEWCKYNEAIRDFTLALNKISSLRNPGVIYLRRGYAYNKIGNREAAISDYKNAADMGDEYAKQNLKSMGVQYITEADRKAQAEAEAKAVRDQAEAEAKAVRDKIEATWDNAKYKARFDEIHNLWNEGEINNRKAFSVFKEFAEGGYPPAQGYLGMCYENGYGCFKNKKKAAEWYEKAADQGLMGACHDIGMCYYEGKGVKKDLTKAAKYFLKGAELGDNNAQFRLAHCYKDGEGVPQDYAKAAEWFRKAAALGDDYAQKGIDKLKAEGKI